MNIGDRMKVLEYRLTEEYAKFKDKTLMMYTSEKGINMRDYFDARKAYEREVEGIISTFILLHGMSAGTCIHILTKVEQKNSPYEAMEDHIHELAEKIVTDEE